VAKTDLSETELALLYAVKSQYATLCADYQMVKDTAESQVAYWRWSQSVNYSPVPFRNERHGTKPGEYVKQKPDKTGGAYETGFDHDNNVVAIREWFLRQQGEDHLNGIRLFEHGSVLKLRSYRTFRGELTAQAYGEGLVKSTQMTRWTSFSEKLEEVNHYSWLNGKLIGIEEVQNQISNKQDSFRRNQITLEWAGDALNAMYSEHGDHRQYYFLELPAGYSVRKSTDTLLEHIYPQVIEALRNTNCDEPIACLGIFVYEDRPIGWIGVKTVKEFQHYIETGDLHTDWNPAEAQINIGIDSYAEHHDAIWLQRHCMLENNWQPAVDLAIEVARKLATTDYTGIAPVSKEFMVYITDMSSNGIADFHQCLPRTVPATLLETIRKRGWLDVQI